ncbi:MAG: N-acetylglucosamine-6-phosphate deacetylase [Acidimicrobiales bacterium]
MTRLGVAAALVDGEVVPGDVEIDHGSVVASGCDPEAGARGGLVVSGLVDLQVNGFGGVEFRSADRRGYARAATTLAAHGAVAVQPTYYGCSIDGYERALRVLAEVRADPPSGCRYLPAHLEGPFLSPAWKGAHDPATFVPPTIETAQRLLAAGPIGMVTLAPELPGATDVIAAFVDAGVVVSVGHTDADSDTIRRALDAGARHVTHVWNAHRRYAPRDPGPAGVALTDPRLTVGLIPDLVHTAAEVVTLTARACRGRLAATTDSIAPAGTDLASFGSTTIVDGAARLPDGTLAGSVATPAGVLANLVRCGVGLADAVDACGGAQRRLLGRSESRLRPGDPADLVVLDDDLRPIRTIVDGVTVCEVT